MIRLRLILVAAAIAIVPYWLAKTLGAFAAIVPFVVGASLGYAMQHGINTAPPSAWERKSTLREKLFGYIYFSTLILTPAIVVGLVGADHGITIGLVSFCAAIWLTLVTLGSAGSVTSRRS